MVESNWVKWQVLLSFPLGANLNGHLEHALFLPWCHTRALKPEGNRILRLSASRESLHWGENILEPRYTGSYHGTRLLFQKRVSVEFQPPELVNTYCSKTFWNVLLCPMFLEMVSTCKCAGHPYFSQYFSHRRSMLRLNEFITVREPGKELRQLVIGKDKLYLFPRPSSPELT